MDRYRVKHELIGTAQDFCEKLAHERGPTFDANRVAFDALDIKRYVHALANEVFAAFGIGILEHVIKLVHDIVAVHMQHLENALFGACELFDGNDACKRFDHCHMRAFRLTLP